MSLSVQIPASAYHFGLDWNPNTSYDSGAGYGRWGWIWGADSQWHREHTWLQFNYTNFNALHINWNQITAVDFTMKLASGGGTDALWTSINLVKLSVNFNYPPSWNYYNTPLQFAWNTPGGIGTDDIDASMVLYKFLDNDYHTFSLPMEQMRYMFDYNNRHTFLLYCPYQPGTTGTYEYNIATNVQDFLYLTVYYKPSLSGDVVMF